MTMISPKNSGKSLRDVGKAVADMMDARMADPREMWGLPWPYATLNAWTGGIHKPELTILEARPAGGKTTIMVETSDSVTNYLATDEGQAEYPDGEVKLVLCESTAEVYLRRWACLRTGIAQKLVQSGKIGRYPQLAEKFKAEMRALARRPIRILDNARSLDEIVTFLMDGNTAWWALDYVQKCPLSPGKPNDGSVGPITLISGALTEVARRKAPGLVLAHTTREVDNREDKRPRLGDIKGGSALEGDARVVLGLFRESMYYKIPTEERDDLKHRTAELTILKNNDGGHVGHTIDLISYLKQGHFEDVTDLTGYEEDD